MFPQARPVIIDTDPGIDDMLALLAALGAPELDVRAVGVTHGNVAAATCHENAARILALAGRPEVPLGFGAARPLVSTESSPIHDVHGDDGLGNASVLLPPAPRTPTRGAVELYAEVLDGASEAVTIIALGPLTNVAALLAGHPELRERIDRIVLMGGADNRGNTSSVAEFNLACDPEAAERVFSDEVPITWVGLELTRTVRFGRDWLAGLLGGGHVSQVAGRVAEFYLNFHEAAGRVGMPVHDAVAVGMAGVDDLGTTIETSVRVECGLGPARGATVVSRHGREPGRAPVAQVVAVDDELLACWIAANIARLDAADPPAN